MKHSASGSMTDSCEPEVVLPCEGSCESILEDLYINLCNLIVESRIPGINERGYGDGCHCPPLMGPNTHKCDYSKLECQKHQRLIFHLLEAIEHKVFEIEVLMLPDCCTEPKLAERLQNKEYLLLERWSMNSTSCKGQSNIEVSQLLRAVRSFLHFSQISAWLSSTKGNSPANVYYRVKPSGDGSSINFEREPEVHSFPVCKISEDLYGCVTVKYPARTQYVPIIPCSKHPPLRGYTFRTIDEKNLCPTIPLNPQLVRQLQITCDTTQSTPNTKTFVPDPATLLLTPVSLLKTFSNKVSDGNISNKIIKHSNCQTDLINTSNLTLDLSKSKNIDVISKSQTAFVVCRKFECSVCLEHTETCSKVQSQESVCFRKRQLAMHLHKAGLKLRKLNTDISVPSNYEIISDSLQPSSNVQNRTTGKVSSIEDCCEVSFQVSNSLSVATSKCTHLEDNSSTSQSKDVTYNNHITRNHPKYFKKRKTVSKRKRDVSADQTPTLPHKKVRCDTLSSSLLLNNTPSSQTNQKTVVIKNINTSHVETEIPDLVSPVSNTEFEICSFETYINNSFSNVNTVPDVKNSVHNDNDLTNYTSMVSKREKMLGQSNNLNSESHVRKRKRALDQNFHKIQKIKPDLDISLQRNLSNETICASEFNNRKRCKTANKLCRIDTISNRVKSTKPNFSQNFSELENKSREKFPELKNITKNKCATPEENLTSGNISVHESSEFPYKWQSSTISCCKKDFCPDRLVRYCNRKNISLNANILSKSTNFYKKSALQTHLGKDKLRTLTKSSIIVHGKKKGHSSSYVKGNFETLDCSRSIEFDSSNEQKERDVSCGLIQSSEVVNSQKEECKIDLKSTLKPLVMKHLKTKFAKIQNKSRNIPKNNYRTNKDISSYKCQSRKMCNLKCANSKHSISKELQVDTLHKTGNSHQYILPKIANINTFKELNCIKKLKSSDEIPHQQSQIQNVTNENSMLQKSGSVLKPLKISHQSDETSTFTLYPTSNAYRNLLYQATNKNLECFPKHVTKFPKAKKLLINFEESILKECLPTVSSVKGFYTEIGASGSFCPNHLTLPADVHFYDLGNSSQGAAPYVAHINLGSVEYYLPRKGAVQVTLFNPSETVVKMFVLNYDLSNMPPLCHTFIRQKIFYLPVGSKEENLQNSQKWLRFIIHLRFASTKTGKIYLHKDFKIVVLNKSNDDAASEFSQEPRELCSFLSVPMNPTFSSI